MSVEKLYFFEFTHAEWVVGGGWSAKSFLCQTQLRICSVEVELSLGCDNISISSKTKCLSQC